MALTPSNMLPLGTKAPDFCLTDTVTNNKVYLKEHTGSLGTVIFFICNHCPFVHHVNHTLVNLANNYSPKGFSFIGISSNDVENYPQDSPLEMKKTAQKLHYPFPYLYDKTQEIAKAYDASCTPDFYVFNKDLNLVYRGQLDDSRPSNGLICNGNDLSKVFESLRSNTEITTTQKPSIGCNIKWKNSNL